jgi:hypothetical protein
MVGDEGSRAAEGLVVRLFGDEVSEVFTISSQIGRRITLLDSTWQLVPIGHRKTSYKGRCVCC